MTSELLSPAGDIQAGYAALHYGADAVYLGLSSFSARAEATNFTKDELERFTNYAHFLNKKVYVAVNTVVFDTETQGLIDTLLVAEQANVDAVIVQDLGVARLVQKYFPRLKLHASTQLAVHNKAGVEALKDLGFKRVVLARELTLEELKDIKTVQGIELETFIHGALCYCYSGLCLFSSTYTGRSANKGKCVYPCREEFKLFDQTKHPFSMKDLMLGESVRLLSDLGITALKIEGRKKNALYVSAVTDYYRCILDGSATKQELDQKRDNITCIFSRPTTELYLKNKQNTSVVDPDIVGHRGLALGKITKVFKSGNDRYISFKTAYEISRFDGVQIDLPNVERPFGFSAEQLRVDGKNTFCAKAKSTVDVKLPDNAPFLNTDLPVYLSSASAVKSAYPYEKPKETLYQSLNEVTVFIEIRTKSISASIQSETVEIAGDFSKANKIELVKKSIHDAFLKTGETKLKVTDIEIHNPDKLFVPMSTLNELRRTLFEKVAPALEDAKTKQNNAFKLHIFDQEQKIKPTQICPVSYSLKTDQIECLSQTDLKNITQVTIEISNDLDLKTLQNMDQSKLCFALPALARTNEPKQLIKSIERLYNNGFRHFEISNVWGLRALKPYKDIRLSCDWAFYVANLSAAQKAIDLGAVSFVVSPESPDPKAIFETYPCHATYVIHQDFPLFMSETCVRTAVFQECQKCGGNYSERIVNRYGKFDLISKKCRHFLLNDKPHIKKAEALSMGAKNLRLDFMVRPFSPQQVSQIVKHLTSDASL